MAGIASTIPASAETNASKPHAIEYGKTLPPVGFVKLCAKDSEPCSFTALSPPKFLTATAERWQLLNEINSYVNHKIAPISDKDLYGEAERWTYPVDAGDCEDYVLLKQRYLQRLGLSASDLLITVVLDEKKEGHAVLTVTTSEGDFVLDNRSDEIRRWDETAYTFLKRQSRQNARQWIALVKEKARNQSITTSKR